MLPLFFILLLMPLGNEHGEETQPFIVPENGYFLPNPERAYLVWENLDLEIKADLKEGKVSKTEILSCHRFITDLGNINKENRSKDDGECYGDPDSFSQWMIASIEKALRSWHFSRYDGSVRLAIRFRSIPSNAEVDTPTYTNYKIDNDWPEWPNARITVEYHHPIMSADPPIEMPIPVSKKVK